MFGIWYAVLLNDKLIDYKPNRMQAETLAERLRDALPAHTAKVNVERDDKRSRA